MTPSTVRPHPARYLPTAPITAVAAVLTLVAALVVAGASQAAALTKPVINGPVFNDPLGTPAQQKAIFTQLVQLIDATPRGHRSAGRCSSSTIRRSPTRCSPPTAVASTSGSSSTTRPM